MYEENVATKPPAPGQQQPSAKKRQARTEVCLSHPGGQRLRGPQSSPNSGLSGAFPRIGLGSVWWQSSGHFLLHKMTTFGKGFDVFGPIVVIISFALKLPKI